jgi:hypothetical protein
MERRLSGALPRLELDAAYVDRILEFITVLHAGEGAQGLWDLDKDLTL